MDRKKTILIAVIINAGLLAVLFVAALFTQEETESHEIAQTQPLSAMTGPAFSNEADSALQQQVAPAPVIHVPVALKGPVTAEESLTPEIAHKLPEPMPVLVAAPVREAPTLEITVRKGDSLDKIAKAHRTTVDEIIKINQLPGSFLKIGQVLKLPDKKSIAQAIKPKIMAEKSMATGPEYYTVKVGDNPWGIAMKHHMKVEELLKLNHLNEERARRLKPGDRLRIR